MAEIPNLAGVATRDLVEQIGSGSFKASYINWARTFNLLHQHAPGWYLEMVLTPDGDQVWRAPGNGGSLMLRFRHTDGTELVPIPQSVMDNRNNPIPYDKISSRDITDTHRRGGCMAAAMTFGLAFELWAKMPLESGYTPQEDTSGAPGVSTPPSSAVDPSEARQAASVVTENDFLAAAARLGLTDDASKALLVKIGTNYSGGIKTLGTKDKDWVAQQNAASETQEPPKPVGRPKPTKAKPEDY